MNDTELYAKLLGIQSPWQVGKVALSVADQRVDVFLEHAPGIRWPCPRCAKEYSCRDHAEERTWRHLDSCQFKTLLHAKIPRVDCPEHGVLQVSVPWAEAHSRFTLLMERFCIDVLQAAENITSAGTILGLSWDETQAIMERAVKRGLTRKENVRPKRLGVDEKAFRKGHHYMTIVCDADRGVVEYVAEHRTTDSLSAYFKGFTLQQRELVEAVAMDMWEPYATATHQQIPLGESVIVHDRFHIMQHMNKAVDLVRRTECRELKREGNPILNGTKYIWLYAEENLPERHRDQFVRIKNEELKVAKAWAIKEALRSLWKQPHEVAAYAFFRNWYQWASKSGLQHVKRVADMIRTRLDRVVRFCSQRLTNGVAEGLNSKIMTIKRRACGYRNINHFKTVIMFYCGGLDLYPTAGFTHGNP